MIGLGIEYSPCHNCDKTKCSFCELAKYKNSQYELQSASEWFTEHGKNTNPAIIGICDRAIYLVNRRDAEINILIRKHDTLLDEIADKNAEIERLETEKVKLHKLIPKMIKEAKAEAIKEFWNELKSRNTLDYRIVSTITGDNLVKEMTEDKK